MLPAAAFARKQTVNKTMKTIEVQTAADPVGAADNMQPIPAPASADNGPGLILYNLKGRTAREPDTTNQDIHAIISANGPLTRGEVWKLYCKSSGRNMSRHGFKSRLSALQRRGLITASIRRPCKVLGGLTFVWQATTPSATKTSNAPRTETN